MNKATSKALTARENPNFKQNTGSDSSRVPHSEFQIIGAELERILRDKSSSYNTRDRILDRVDWRSLDITFPPTIPEHWLPILIWAGFEQSWIDKAMCSLQVNGFEACGELPIGYMCSGLSVTTEKNRSRDDSKEKRSRIPFVAVLQERVRQKLVEDKCRTIKSPRKNLNKRLTDIHNRLSPKERDVLGILIRQGATVGGTRVRGPEFPWHSYHGDRKTFDHAFRTLKVKQLIEANRTGYRLTQDGTDVASFLLT